MLPKDDHSAHDTHGGEFIVLKASKMKVILKEE